MDAGTEFITEAGNHWNRSGPAGAGSHGPGSLAPRNGVPRSSAPRRCAPKIGRDVTSNNNPILLSIASAALAIGVFILVAAVPRAAGPGVELVGILLLAAGVLAIGFHVSGGLLQARPRTTADASPAGFELPVLRVPVSPASAAPGDPTPTMGTAPGLSVMTDAPPADLLTEIAREITIPLEETSSAAREMSTMDADATDRAAALDLDQACIALKGALEEIARESPAAKDWTPLVTRKFTINTMLDAMREQFTALSSDSADRLFLQRTGPFDLMVLGDRDRVAGMLAALAREIAGSGGLSSAWMYAHSGFNLNDRLSVTFTIHSSPAGDTASEGGAGESVEYGTRRPPMSIHERRARTLGGRAQIQQKDGRALAAVVTLSFDISPEEEEGAC